jgi:hypothetical protein
MLFKKLAAVITGCAAAVSALPAYSPASPLQQRQAAELVCPAGTAPEGTPVYTVTYYKQIVVYPVLINTYYQTNTVITITGGITISIINAPTSVSTVVTATVTQTITNTL